MHMPGLENYSYIASWGSGNGRAEIGLYTLKDNVKMRK